jgi:hypothetical protein
MDADWSVELGHDDPALEFPWASPDGLQSYVDLSKDLSGLSRIVEAVRYPALQSLLIAINGRLTNSGWLSVKCDAWIDNQVSQYEGPEPVQWRMASYVDVIRRDVADRFSFERHEAWLKAVAQRLRHYPEAPYSCELVMRRCYYRLENDPQGSAAGFCVTIYVFGYGDTEEHAECNSWKGALDRVSFVLTGMKF